MRYTQRMRVIARAMMALAMAAAGAGRAAAVPPGSVAATEALAICEGIDAVPIAKRPAALARGVAIAEAAVNADHRDARAHYALVCNLGKKMEAEGFGLGQLVGIFRLRRALDVALALAPNDADTLTAKGALLLRLPRFLGGDAAEAEVLLRRAVTAEPDNRTAQCYLEAAIAAHNGTASREPTC